MFSIPPENSTVGNTPTKSFRGCEKLKLRLSICARTSRYTRNVLISEGNFCKISRLLLEIELKVRSLAVKPIRAILSPSPGLKLVIDLPLSHLATKLNQQIRQKYQLIKRN